MGTEQIQTAAGEVQARSVKNIQAEQCSDELGQGTLPTPQCHLQVGGLKKERPGHDVGCSSGRAESEGWPLGDRMRV